MALVIAIAGPTGAGKSTLTTSLQAHYSASMPVFHVPQDSYYFVRSAVHPLLPYQHHEIDRNISDPSLARRAMCYDRKMGQLGSSRFF